MNRITLEVFDGKTTLRYEKNGAIVEELQDKNDDVFLNIPTALILNFAKNWISELGLIQEEIKIAKKQIFLSWSDEPKRAMLKRSLDKIFALEVDEVLTLDMDRIAGIRTAYHKAVKDTDKKFTFNRIDKQWKITRLR